MNGEEIVWVGTGDGHMIAVKEVTSTSAQIVMDFGAGGPYSRLSCQLYMT